jgi:DNA segregation ATPase FtsK/SpoIIIE, S-DNA-T family
MADNFNLRSFLSENKLTKNAKLISEEQNLDEASFSDSYDTPASMAVYRQLTSIVDIFKKSGQEEREELDAAIAAAEQETGTEVTPAERNTLHKQLRWIRTHSMEMEREGVENEEPVMEASYKAPSNSKEAQHLKKGDITGSGDEVVSVSAGAKTPAGKVEVTLKTKSGSTKTSLWGKTTKIGLKKVEESKLTAKEQALVEMVQNALGMAPQAVAEEAPIAEELPIAEEVPMAEDEMVQEKSLPKYKNIDELMSNIEHGTNEAAHKYKMERMKEVAEALEAKVTSLEEGENAEHIDQKAVKQMRKDILALRKAEEKLRKEFEKKFASKKEAKEDK